MRPFQASQKYNEALRGAVYILRLRENFSVKSRTRSLFRPVDLYCLSWAYLGGGGGGKAEQVFVLKQNHQFVVLEI